MLPSMRFFFFLFLIVPSLSLLFFPVDWISALPFFHVHPPKHLISQFPHCPSFFFLLPPSPLAHPPSAPPFSSILRGPLFFLDLAFLLSCPHLRPLPLSYFTQSSWFGRLPFYPPPPLNLTRDPSFFFPRGSSPPLLVLFSPPPVPFTGRLL